mgnify:CR=1 FL=1
MRSILPPASTPQLSSTPISAPPISSPLVWPALVLAALLFYAPLLFQPDTSIHWDLAGQSYPAQKFFAEQWKQSGVPLGTRNTLTGIPFVGDLTTGAFYPLHWPMFALGITPKSLAWELALHSAIALTGAYALAGTGPAALGAALAYGFGGFFAAQSSRLGLFECAAWLPWILFAARRASQTGASQTGKRRWGAGVALFLGLSLLAGSLPGSVTVLAALLVTAITAPSLALALGTAAGILLGGLVWKIGRAHV